MDSRALALQAWLALALLTEACAPFAPKPFDSDGEFKQYVSSLQISGVTAQAATTKLEHDGFACQTANHVIEGAPNEWVVVCQRHASGGGCQQDQSLVLQLDWVATPRPQLAPGMRVKSIGTAAAPKACG